MTKKWIAVLLVAVMVCGMLSGCKKEITAEEAHQIVLEELGDLAAITEGAHIHESTYDDKPCFNVYITVEDLSLVYVVSTTGKILASGPSEHSH